MLKPQFSLPFQSFSRSGPMAFVVLVIIAGMFAAVGSARAQQNNVYLEFLNTRTQTGASTYEYGQYNAHALNASPSENNPANITTPGSIGTIEVTNSGSNYFYATSAELNTDFGQGKYDFTILVDDVVVNMPSVTAAGDFTYQSFLAFSSIQNINTAQDFTFTWTNPGSMTQNDFYDFILYDSVTFDFIAYETFAVGDTASYTVGSNSFTEGQTYTAVLSYYSPNTVIDEDYRSSVSYGSNNMIEFTTVPEPSTVALVVLGGVAGLLGLARRRSARCCATPS